jgi:hypothetical protein
MTQLAGDVTADDWVESVGGLRFKSVTARLLVVMASISNLDSPFWIVTQRRGLIFQPVESDRMPDLIAAFSSAENAAKLMLSRGEKE